MIGYAERFLPTLSLPSPEAEVVLWLKRGLTAGALYGDAVSDVLVDADGSYTGSPHARGLRPFGTVRIGEWRPGLVCAQDRGGVGVQRVPAFAVKGLRDHEKGVVQAERYRHGADESYVCVPGDPSSWLRRSAERLGVGVVAAKAEEVRVVVSAPAPQPEVGAREALRRRLLGERDFRAFDSARSGSTSRSQWVRHRSLWTHRRSEEAMPGAPPTPVAENVPARAFEPTGRIESGRARAGSTSPS
jgi:hypothetical protein